MQFWHHFGFLPHSVVLEWGKIVTERSVKAKEKTSWTFECCQKHPSGDMSKKKKKMWSVAGWRAMSWNNVKWIVWEVNEYFCIHNLFIV